MTRNLATNFTGITSSVNKYGFELDGSSSARFETVLVPGFADRLHRDSGGFTVIIGLRYTTTSNLVIMEITANELSAQTFTTEGKRWLLNIGGTLGSGGGQLFLDEASGVRDGNPHIIIASIGVNLSDDVLYLDGDPVGSSTGSTSDPAYGSVNHMDFFSRNGSFAYTDQAFLISLLDRPVTEDEVRHITADPFGPFRMNLVPVAPFVQESAVTTVQEAASISITAKLAGRGFKRIFRKAGATTLATLNARATNIHFGRSAIKATFTLDVAGTGSGLTQGKSKISASFSVGARGRSTLFRKAGISSVASLGAIGTVSRVRKAGVSSSFSVGARSTNTHFGRAASKSTATLNARAFRETRQAASVSAAFSVGARSTNLHFGRGAISAAFSLGALGSKSGTVLRRAGINVTTTLTATSLNTHFGRAGISAAFSVGAIGTNTTAAAAARPRDFPMLLNIGKFIQK